MKNVAGEGDVSGRLRASEGRPANATKEALGKKGMRRQRRPVMNRTQVAQQSTCNENLVLRTVRIKTAPLLDLVVSSPRSLWVGRVEAERGLKSRAPALDFWGFLWFVPPRWLCPLSMRPGQGATERLQAKQLYWSARLCLPAVHLTVVSLKTGALSCLLACCRYKDLPPDRVNSSAPVLLLCTIRCRYRASRIDISVGYAVTLWASSPSHFWSSCAPDSMPYQLLHTAWHSLAFGSKRLQRMHAHRGALEGQHGYPDV